MGAEMGARIEQPVNARVAIDANVSQRPEGEMDP